MTDENNRRSVEELYVRYQLTRRRSGDSPKSSIAAKTVVTGNRLASDIAGDIASDIKGVERLFLSYQSQRESDQSSSINSILNMAADYSDQQEPENHIESKRAILDFAASHRAVNRPNSSGETNTAKNPARESKASTPRAIVSKGRDYLADLLSVHWTVVAMPAAAIVLLTVFVFPGFNDRQRAVVDGRHQLLMDNAAAASKYTASGVTSAYSLSGRGMDTTVPFHLGVLAADLKIALQANNLTAVQALAGKTKSIGSKARLNVVLERAVEVQERSTETPAKIVESGYALLDAIDVAGAHSPLYQLGSDTEALHLAAQLAANESNSAALHEAFGYFRRSAAREGGSLSALSQSIVNDILSLEASIPTSPPTSTPNAMQAPIQTGAKALASMVTLTGELKDRIE